MQENDDGDTDTDLCREGLLKHAEMIELTCTVAQNSQGLAATVVKCLAGLPSWLLLTLLFSVSALTRENQTSAVRACSRNTAAEEQQPG